jgi:hypothetical protein
VFFFPPLILNEAQQFLPEVGKICFRARSYNRFFYHLRPDLYRVADGHQTAIRSRSRHSCLSPLITKLIVEKGWCLETLNKSGELHDD